MKILRIISSMNPVNGGPCQGIRNAIPELLKMGIKNDVVCFDDPNATFIENDAFPIYALGQGKTPWQYNHKLVPWLLENICNYNIVIIHGLWLYHSYATFKVLNIYKKKHIEMPKVYIMPHGMLDPYFQLAKDRKLKAKRNNIYWKFIESKVINNVDGVLFTCEEELKLAKSTFPNYKPKKEINIGYGIQSPPKYSQTMREAFTSKMPNWNGDPYLLFLSRIHPKKGVDMLIKAYLKLEREMEHIPQLVIAGPGLNETFGKEMQMIASKSQNILFPGMLTGNAKWGAFYECEAFILPSHQENFGIAVAEALACGKPVLISNKVNIWREIKNGEGGMIYRDTPNATSNLLFNWLKLKDKRKIEMSHRAKAVYLKHFTNSSAAKTFQNSL